MTLHRNTFAPKDSNDVQAILCPRSKDSTGFYRLLSEFFDLTWNLVNLYSSRLRNIQRPSTDTTVAAETPPQPEVGVMSTQKKQWLMVNGHSLFGNEAKYFMYSIDCTMFLHIRSTTMMLRFQVVRVILVYALNVCSGEFSSGISRAIKPDRPHP